jgi:hypothetical protein
VRRLAPLLALLAFAGCSNGSSATITAADDSDRAAYIAEADALCARIAGEHPEVAASAERIQKLKRNDPKFLDKAAEHFALVLRVARVAQDEFTGLGPPEADEDKVEELNEMNAQAISSLEEAEAELRAGREGTEQFKTYAARLAAADKLAQDYGLEVCSRISTS